MERRAALVLAALIVLDAILLIPVVLAAVAGSSWLWLFLGVYVAGTAAALAGAASARGWSGHSLAGQASPVLIRALAVVGLPTLALMLALAVAPRLSPAWLVLYLVAVVAGLAWLIRWQAANYLLSCRECGNVFERPTRSWALSLNLGAYKGIACPACGHWPTRVIRRSGLAAENAQSSAAR